MQIDLNKVCVSYAQSETVLDGVDLQIESGEFIGITGKAGTGKTTLIDVIGGLTGIGWIATLIRLYLIYKGMSNALNGRKEKLPWIGNILE